MTKLEAYRILSKMWNDVTQQQEDRMHELSAGVWSILVCLWSKETDLYCMEQEG